jgi:hypothetical protein
MYKGVQFCAGYRKTLQILNNKVFQSSLKRASFHKANPGVNQETFSKLIKLPPYFLFIIFSAPFTLLFSPSSVRR